MAIQAEAFPATSTTVAPPLFSRWKVVLLAVLAQALLVGRTFSALLFNPGKYLIVTHYDGIKSYFSVASFLRQPLSDGMLVRGHNYPFGEYMYYTDSTPLLVAPLHALVQAVPALAPYGLYLYDLFILSSLVVSTGLLVLVFRRLALPAWLTVLLSVALPWLGPQTVRLVVGHMSLAYTPAMVFLIWGLLRLYTAWRAEQPLARHFGLLLLGIVATSWLHFYYLPILGGSLAFFVVALVFESWRTQRAWKPLALGLGITLAGSAVLTWGLLQVLDPWIHQRLTGSNGYDWIEWKFQFGALFKGYNYNKIRFPLERTAYVPYESSAYLTSFVLFGLLLVLLLRLFKRLPPKAGLAPASADNHQRFLLLLLVSSLPFFFIALGDSIDVDNGSYVAHNYLNVFFWLRKVTERVTQFRALGRFIWPFWWAVVVAFSWYIARWRSIPGLRWGLLGLCTLLVVDTVNAVRSYSLDTQRSNLLTDPGATAAVREFLGWSDASRYQAILPLPYSHSGTDGENYPLTVDPDDTHSNLMYQASMVSGLPLMTHKAARAVPAQAALLFSMFRPEGPAPELLARLDQRPILVFVDTAFFDGRNNYYRDAVRDRPLMKAAFEREPAFILEQHMRRIRHQGTWSLYEWYPKGAPPAAAGKP